MDANLKDITNHRHEDNYNFDRDKDRISKNIGQI